MIRPRLLALAFTAAAALSPLAPALADEDMEVHDRIEQVLGSADDLDQPLLAVREAVVNGDAAALAEFVEFPLRTSDGEIADADELADQFDSVITPAVKKAIGRMQYRDLIVNSDGVGMGNGAIWMSPICEDNACESSHWAVISINN